MTPPSHNHHHPVYNGRHMRYLACNVGGAGYSGCVRSIGEFEMAILNEYAESASVLGKITPSSQSEALLNSIKDLRDECERLADMLVGTAVSATGSELKSVPSSGLFGEIAENNSECQKLARDAKSHISRIRNAIGK